MRRLPSDYQHTHTVWCRPMEGSSSNSHHTLHLLEEWLKTMEELTDQACYHNYLRQKYRHFSWFGKWTFFTLSFLDMPINTIISQTWFLWRHHFSSLLQAKRSKVNQRTNLCWLQTLLDRLCMISSLLPRNKQRAWTCACASKAEG